MTNVIAKHRHQAAVRQHGRCHYCGKPMWENNPTGFCQRYRLSQREVTQFECTAEHLQAKCDGGGNQRQNIVAACRYCNQNRHRAKRPLTAVAYRLKVQSRVRQGKWHHTHLVEKMTVKPTIRKENATRK